MRYCLSCYEPLTDGGHDFHEACSRRMFGSALPPDMPYSESDLEPLARQIIQSRMAVTGVQPKISLDVSGNDRSGHPRRFTMVGLWGGYILKPPTTDYPQLPEVEDLTMHLAQLAGIRTAAHSLIRLKSGSMAYLSKRMDRTREGKLAMEDMCQLTERLTEDKYHGSYEQIGKAVRMYSSNPGLDLVVFFETLLFCFLTGNADMNLKKFSLLEQPGVGMVLSPAYDLVNTALVNPADKEDLALTLNGRKRRIVRRDFTAAMDSQRLSARQQQNIFDNMARAMPRWMQRIDISFLSDGYKKSYKAILTERAGRVL